MEEEAWILLFEVISASSSIRDCHISLHSVCSCGLLLMMKAVLVCGELVSVCVTGINLISLLVTNVTSVGLYCIIHPQCACL